MADEFTLADPKTTPKKTAQPAKPASSVQAANGLGEFAARLDDISDPFTRSLVKGAVEARLSDRLGFQFRFEDPAEQELAAEKTQRQMLEEHLKVKALKAQIVQGAILDLDETQRAALGIEPGEDVLTTDPAKAVAASDMLFEAQLIPFKLTLSDLKAAGMPTNEVEAQSMAEQRQAEQQKKLGAAASGLRASEELGKAFTEATEGEGVIGGKLTDAIEGAEEATGKDIVDDADEDEGSSLFHDLITNAVDDIASATGQEKRFVASAVLSGKIGARLRDELEGLDESNGLLVVGKGDSGVTDTASFYLAATALELGAEAGLSDSETMRALKLPYKGVDPGSLMTAIEDTAQKRGVDKDTLIRSFRPGFMEALSRLAAKERAVAGVQ